MPIEWPENLVKQIAANQWVLFIGSGVSASCCNAAGNHPPTWSDLLLRLCGKIGDKVLRETGIALISNGDLISAADHIQYAMTKEHNHSLYLSEIRTAVTGPPGSPFRPSNVFDLLLSLEPRVVFTTNYDKLFEQASLNAFSMHTYASRSLAADVRRGDPVFVKLHGSSDEISKIVLTRADYGRLSKDGEHVFATLRALSLTSTILFVGYSFGDPDIQLALQAIGWAELAEEAHFMVAPEPTTPSRAPVFRATYGVTIMTYPTGAHSCVEDALSSLSGQVLAERARARGET